MTEYRIVTAKYDPSGVSVTDPIYKGNYGNILRLVDFPEGMVPETFEMHFSVGGGIAKTQIGTSNEVKILDECLTKVVPITAWLFLHDAATDGETKHEIRIPVKPKDNVTDAEPTPVEQSVITQAIAALNTGVERAETAADAAEDAQEGAEAAATRAEQAATEAQGAAESAAEDAVEAVEQVLAGYKQAAESAATRAENSATDANASRESADQSATAAGVSERNARASAEAAAGSASAAEGSATTATEKATEAAGYAASMTDSVQAAQVAAQTATTKAGEASQSASTAAQKAQEAASSATSASQSATAANTAKTQADAAKNDAVTAKNAAQTAATNAASSAQTAQDVADSIPADYDKMIIVSDTQPANETHNKIWIKNRAEEEYTIPTYEEFEQVSSAITNKADVDGTYENLTSGNTLEVLSDRGTSDTEPYLFRKALGWNRAKLNKVVGGTVAWNQLIDKNPVNIARQNNVSATYDSANDTIKVTSTKDANDVKRVRLYKEELLYNHVYFASGTMVSSVPSTYTRKSMFGFFNHSEGANIVTEVGGGETKSGNWIIKTGDGSSSLAKQFVGIRVSNEALSGEYVEVKNMICIDLTQMFGSTIADYIYSLETSTAGAGVALFRSWFPNDYYEYNPGELISVSGLQSGETVGFNQWDEEFEIGGINDTTGEKVAVPSQKRSKNFIKTVSGQNYYLFASGIGTGGVWVYLYDSSYAFIGRARASSYNIANTIFSTPDNCQYMLFKMQPDNAVGQAVKICINISDPSRNGTYKPYVKHSYPLDSSLTLRGVPNLVDNKLAFDGDRYLPDGTVERRYGIVDLGTLNYTIYNHATLGQYFYANIASLNVKRAGVYVNVKFPAVCAKYAVTSRYQSAFVDKCLCFDGDATKVTELQIKDSSYNNAADFKASLSGVYLVYELATPTSETAEPYRNLQIQEKGGTEQFVSNAELPVPVGHETFYPINIFDYIDQAIAAALNA